MPLTYIKHDLGGHKHTIAFILSPSLWFRIHGQIPSPQSTFGFSAVNHPRKKDAFGWKYGRKMILIFTSKVLHIKCWMLDVNNVLSIWNDLVCQTNLISTCQNNLKVCFDFHHVIICILMNKCVGSTLLTGIGCSLTACTILYASNTENKNNQIFYWRKRINTTNT